MNEIKRQYDGLDLLKFCCSIIIVFLHINPLPKESILYNWSRAIAHLGVPCFFIMSGFFLFTKLLNVDKSEKKVVLRGQLKRIFSLLGIWMIVYFVVYDFEWIIKGDIDKNLLEYFRCILFGGNGFFLWYLVALIVAILLCYLIHDTSMKIALPLVTILFLIGSIGSSYTFGWQETKVKEVIELYTSIFVTFRNGVFFGFPCVFWGMMLAKKNIASLKTSVLSLVVSIIIYISEFYILMQYGYVFNIMQISVISLAGALVCVGTKINIKISKDVAYSLRKLSFLIYVIHPLLIKIIPNFLRVIPRVEYYWYLWWWLQIPIIVLGSVLCGYMIIRLSHKVKFLQLMM